MTPPLPMLVRQLVVHHDAKLTADLDRWRFVVPAWPKLVFTGDTLEQIEEEVARYLLETSVAEDGVTEDGLLLSHVTRLRDEVREEAKRLRERSGRVDPLGFGDGKRRALEDVEHALTGMLDEVLG